MKKRFLGLTGIIALLGFGVSTLKVTPKSVHAEELPVAECTVVIEQSEHGTITADKTEGSVGELVTLTVENNFLYLIESVKVNETALVESDNTKGLFTFALVAGENKVSASFIVDQETLGVFSTMYQEATEKDWTNLFSVENVLTIVKWLLDGGVLIMLIRYAIKDKKTADKLEKTTKDTLNTIVPDTVKETVVKTVNEVLKPIFANLGSQMADVSGATASVVKCIALSQQNTPESKQAIIEELSKVKISDATTLAEIKKYVNEAIAGALKAKDETLAKIESIKAENKKIIEQKEEQSKEVKGDTYDGTSI